MSDNLSAALLVTRELPGTQGRIKSEPAHFVVEELPLYPLSGAGEHVWVRHRREGFTTRELVTLLARAAGVRERDVGYAGLKDKVARATQSFSLPLPRADLEELRTRLADALPGELLELRRHQNKARRGHSLGNRFEITIQDCVPDALSRAQAVLAALDAHGLPNAYGPQRFGRDGRNAERGQSMLCASGAHARRGWQAHFELCAWQAAQFNLWLVERMRQGDFERLFVGDVAKRLDNGALFDVADESAENERLVRHEITYTGPLFGFRMRTTQGAPAELEARVLAASGVTLERLEASELAGSRRAARIFPADVELRPLDGGLWLGFKLPKGSYATTLLSEIMKSAAQVPDALDED